MPNPKKKHTRHRTGIRRGSNWRLEPVSYYSCPNCKNPKLPHAVCPSCGFYAGRQVVAPKVKKTKEEPQGQ
ncbi:MAG: 50S ribosomal protein L32 [Elusimicrobia bacterium]|nr:50S ribosomal protein L32 [Elusimicrobiota bacterium]